MKKEKLYNPDKTGTFQMMQIKELKNMGYKENIKEKQVSIKIRIIN